MQIKARDQKLKERWEQLLRLLTDQFSETDEIEIEGVLYLIGLQELGKIHQRFKKDDNINIIHIGICTVLEPFGYYAFDFYDEEGWPHFKLLEDTSCFKAWRANCINERGDRRLLLRKRLDSIGYFLFLRP